MIGRAPPAYLVQPSLLPNTRVAAISYGPIESAKLSGVEPSAYIREPTRRPIESPATVTLPSSLRE